MVVQELENKGYSIEKKRVEVPEHNIRMVGTYTVKVRLYGNEEAHLNISVEAAEEK
jgi:large subunit ribosomal protein L9